MKKGGGAISPEKSPMVIAMCVGRVANDPARQPTAKSKAPMMPVHRTPIRCHIFPTMIPGQEIWRGCVIMRY